MYNLLTEQIHAGLCFDAKETGDCACDTKREKAIDLAGQFISRLPALREVLSTEGSVSARNGKGGTSPLRVREQIVSAKTAIEQLRAFANSVSDGPAYKTPESLLK